MIQTAEFESQQAQVTRQQRDEAFRASHPEYFAFKANQPAAFKARVGKCPSYPTSHEAVQYERGFNEYPNQPWGLIRSPRMSGYLDAEEAHERALLAQAARRTTDFGVLA